MKLPATSSVPTPGNSADEGLPLCRVLIVHENRATLERALDLYRRIESDLDTEIRFECISRRFDELEASSVRISTAAEAAEAHVIVVSARVDLKLPASMREWMELWLPEAAARDIALVALLDAPSGSLECASAIRDSLEAMTLKHGVDFFSEFEPSSSPRPRHAGTMFRGQPAVFQ